MYINSYFTVFFLFKNENEYTRVSLENSGFRKKIKGPKTLIMNYLKIIKILQNYLRLKKSLAIPYRSSWKSSQILSESSKSPATQFGH